MKKSLILTSLFFLSTTAIAADKVVVVPLGSSKTPSTAAFIGGNQNFTLDGTVQTVRSLTINVPSDGTVIVTASGGGNFKGLTQDYATGSISTSNAIDPDYVIGIHDFGATEIVNVFQSFASTRGYSVTAGTHTYNLVMIKNQGTMEIVDSTMTAIFIPN